MDFTTLRPAAPTSAAIAEAAERARAAETSTAARIIAAKSERDALLLDGDAEQLAAAEKALVDARGDGERVEAILAELAARLATTKMAEAVSDVRVSLEASRIATDARRVWWEKNSKRLQNMLREVSELHVGQQDAAELSRRRQINFYQAFSAESSVLTDVLEQVPAAKDVDETTWRVLEEITKAWQSCKFYSQLEEDAR